MISALFILAAIEDALLAQPTDLLGIAAVITAVGVTFASIVSSVILVIARATRKTVAQIDHAVNGKGPRERPMVDQVDDLHAQLPVPLTAKAAWLEEAVVAIAEHQGIDLPDRYPVGVGSGD